MIFLSIGIDILSYTNQSTVRDIFNRERYQQILWFQV